MKVLYILLASSLAIFLLLNLAIINSFAAETEETASKPSPVYPVEIEEIDREDSQLLIYTYHLPPHTATDIIPVEDFEREGNIFTLLDITAAHNLDQEQQDYVEAVIIASDTDDIATNLALFAPTIEVITPEGYSGTLNLDTESLVATAEGYGSSSRTVTAERSYPGLSIADTSLLPKSIEDNGHTLDLADVSWQETNGPYTANASYSTTVSSSYVSEYLVTAKYSGQVSKVVDEYSIYTVTFSGTPLPLEEMPESSIGSWLIPLISFVVGGGLTLGTVLIIRKRRESLYCE